MSVKRPSTCPSSCCRPPIPAGLQLVGSFTGILGVLEGGVERAGQVHPVRPEGLDTRDVVRAVLLLNGERDGVAVHVDRVGIEWHEERRIDLGSVRARRIRVADPVIGRPGHVLPKGVRAYAVADDAIELDPQGAAGRDDSRSVEVGARGDCEGKDPGKGGRAELHGNIAGYSERRSPARQTVDETALGRRVPKRDGDWEPEAGDADSNGRTQTRSTRQSPDAPPWRDDC